MKTPKVLLSAADIATRVRQLGKDISVAYENGPITAIGVMNGGLFFLADLVRSVEPELTYQLIRAASYGASTAPERAPQVTLPSDFDIRDRDVLLVEDIVDTGATLNALRQELEAHRPASLKVAVLCDKPARRQVDVAVDWIGFEVPDAFLVGYGLDHAEKYRNLPYIGVL